jgi:hypothetical protein
MYVVHSALKAPLIREVAFYTYVLYEGAIRPIPQHSRAWFTACRHPRHLSATLTKNSASGNNLGMEIQQEFNLN